MIKPSNYVIWGSSGHAKVLASLVNLYNGQVIALFDNNSKMSSILPGVPLFIGEAGFTNWACGANNPKKIAGLVAIGGRKGCDRMAIQAMFQSYGLLLPNLIHPGATVCSTAQLENGTQILAQAVVAAECQLGAGCIVNHGASIDHECKLSQGVHVAPGATICGCVKIGRNTMIGAGAVVLPRITIGAEAMVGAGAVVTRDVPAGSVVIGNPARSI